MFAAFAFERGVEAAVVDDGFQRFFQRGLGGEFGGDLFDENDEFAQGVARTTAEVAGDLRVVAEDAPQRYARLLGELAQVCQGFLSDAARWGVDDALNGAVVVTVAGETQVGERVFDFGAFEEAQAAVNAVRQTVLQEHFFKNARLGVGAVEDGAFVVAAAVCMPALDVLADVARFVHFVDGGVDAYCCAALAVAPQGFAEAVAVLCDDGVGGIKDGLG